MPDIREWLGQIGCGQYAEAFAENAIEFDLLPDLTDEDLRTLGVAALGHRKRILKAASQVATGAESAEPVQVAAPIEPLATAGEAERRQITVMFCDLVGSTELAQRLDPEDLRLVNRRYQELARVAIESHEGFVARYMGDGVLAYFGYPMAHEDDPERAVRSAQSLIRSLADGLEGEQVAARTGIATGPVVVGDLIGEGASQENAVVGETPNLAARLQSLAPPNGIVASETTRALVGDTFRFHALPSQQVRGFTEPVRPYQVGSELLGQSRFGARTGTSVSPLVGREEEMEFLTRWWRGAVQGEGGAVLLVGEPGIGKSRLVEQLRLEAIAGSAQVLLFQCSRNYRNTAFHPVIARLDSTISPYRRDDARTAQLVRDFVSGDELDDGEDPEVFASLLYEALGLEGDTTLASLESLDADAKRRRLMSALLRFIRNHERAAPLLCIVEDLHWADPSSTELISRLIENLPGMRALVVVTSRPGLQPSWSDLPHARVVSLPRLSETVAGELASAVAPLNSDIVAQVVDRAGGNPLFIEELARSLSSSADISGRAQLVPATLQDSLMARLDATGPGRAVAQCASVLGREFSQSMLSAIWDGDPGSLGAGVRAILEAGLLYERTTTTGEEEFQFKHTLVRDAAYSSLLRERRRALHQRTAQHMMELRSVNPRAASPEGIAHHLTEADDISNALEYWLQAGEASARTSSYRECEAHLREALALIEHSEDREAHARSELELLVLLGPALMALYGYSATPVGEAYERARALSERLSDKPHLTPILNGLRLFDLCRHGCAQGHESAAALMSHADALGDDASRIEGCKALGSVSVWSGKLVDASELLERGIAIYEAGENADAMRLDSDSGLTCHSFLSLAIWARGDVASAIRHMETAQQIAEEARRTFGINECMCFRALLLQLMRQNDRAEATAREALNLANQHDYVLWKAMSSLVLGAAQTANGDPVRGLENLSAAYRLMTEMNYIVWRPLALVELGRAFEQREDQAKALEHLSEALAVINRTDERFWQPEAYRTRGLVFKSQGELRLAEDSYREAIDCADSLEHRTASLRACTSLATLSLDTGGDVSDARAMLEARLAAVGTAPDTDDIRDARVTLSRSISA